MLDLPGPCGFMGVLQRKPSMPCDTALSPRTECWCALALVARDAKGQWDTPFPPGGGMGVLALRGTLAEAQRALQHPAVLQL